MGNPLRNECGCPGEGIGGPDPAATNMDKWQRE